VASQIIASIESDENLKAQKISHAIDYTNPTTRDYALKLVTIGTTTGIVDINQICDIWDYGNGKWVYVNDPEGSDYYSPASRTINLGLKGDCDDFAILNAAVMESIGGKSRIITACSSKGICHAYAEVYMDDNNGELQSITNSLGKRYGIKTVYYHTDVNSKGNREYWLNLDWQADNPGGEIFLDTGSYGVYYPNGKYKVVNNSGFTVYHQTPTISSIVKSITPTSKPTLVVQRIITPSPTVIQRIQKVTTTPTKSLSEALKEKGVI